MCEPPAPGVFDPSDGYCTKEEIVSTTLYGCRNGNNGDYKVIN
jgi:hypothetical protein